MENIEVMEQIGLTRGEIKVYFALLELGQTTTGNIIKRSGVHSSKVYPILDNLMKKGLASYIYRGKKRHYQASDPRKIIDFINEKKNLLEKQKTNISALIPVFVQRQKLLAHKQSAAVYEGIEGIRTLFDRLLEAWKKGDDYLTFSPGEDYRNEQINRFFKIHHKKRIKRGIIVRTLALPEQREFYQKAYKKIRNFEFRYTRYSLPSGINIAGNLISLLIWEPTPVAFVIESEILSKRFSSFFKELWKAANR